MNKIQYIIHLLQHNIINLLLWTHKNTQPSIQLGWIQGCVFVKTFVTRSRFHLCKPNIFVLPSFPVSDIKGTGHKSAACRRFKHASHSAVHTRIEHPRKSGSEGASGKLLTYEHTAAPYVSEDTRVCFTEQISGHYSSYDPGLHWGQITIQMGGHNIH